MNILYKLGVSVSYDRIIEVEDSIASAICKRFREENLVCPVNLRRGLFTIGALDNIDHNPSSTTAQGSFHGTGISVFQFPTPLNYGIPRESLIVESLSTKEFILPDNYTNVPAVSCNTDRLTVSDHSTSEISSQVLEAGKINEFEWIEHSMPLLSKNEIGKEEYISWAAYHASLEPSPENPSTIVALLPLFHEKAATIAMIKHGMDIQQSITQYLNPGQIPVMAFDQPLFALAKFVQWCWPEKYGEQHYVVMFGGLHIEMAIWNTIGDFLHDSGWTTALCEAEIASSGIAESFLKSSHLTTTRHGHQVTALTLAQLQYEAWKSMTSEESFEDWKKRMVNRSPTFQYWNIVLEFEILAFTFIRAHRLKSFDLFVKSLESLAPWFFALDHVNYARWIPIHVEDMKSLPAGIKEQLKSSWVVQKTQKKFSSMPIDQAHEQSNEHVKGSGGAVGLTENPSAFRRWMVAGPEQARLLAEFEGHILKADTADQQHEQGCSTQRLFQKQVNSLSAVISNMGNPFLDDCPELLALHTRDCTTDAVVETVHTIESLGRAQYQQYVTDVIVNRTVQIQQPIKKNSLPLFKRPSPKRSKKVKQDLANLKSDCNLFSHLYIASKFRD